MRNPDRVLTILVIAVSMAASACAARRIHHYDYVFSVTGVVIGEDGTPLKDAEATLEPNGSVYEAVTLVKTAKLLTNDTGGFVFAYTSGDRGVKYTLTVRKKGFETQTVSGSAPPPGNHTIRLKNIDGPQQPPSL